MRLLPTSGAMPGGRVPKLTSARVLAAGFNVAAGLRLLAPDDILSNPLAPGYRLLRTHFNNDIPLGLALLAFGVVMVAAFYTDQRWTSVATWLSFLTWVVVAVDIALVSLSQLGSLVYILVACLNAWAYVHHTLWLNQVRRDLLAAA